MILQSTFTLGEISKLLYSRVDFDGYYKAAKRLRNVLVLPQGSVVRRFGTSFIGEVINISDYEQTKYAVLQYFDTETYLAIFRPLAIDVYYNDAKVATVVSTYTAGEIKDLRFTQDSNVLYIMHPDHQTARLARGGDHASWSLTDMVFRNLPAYAFDVSYIALTFTPSATSGASVTLTASAPIFNANYVGGLFFGNSGTLRITGFTDSTHVTGRTTTDFANLNPISGSDAFLGEPAFSAARGWPKTATFHQNRLIFGGSKSVPEGIFASVTGEYDDFDTGTGLDSEAINIAIRGDKANIIKHILHTTNLIMFTSSGVYSSPPFTDKPITPKDFYMPEQSKDGVSDANPVVIDNKIIFVDIGGKIVRGLVYDIQRGSYVGNNVSITASHLVKNPISVAAFTNPAVYDGQYALFVNDDGTLAVYQSLESQNVFAWSLSTTDGYFREVVSSGTDVYFLVERNINGQQRFFIEKLDFSIYNDCALTFNYILPAKVIEGLGHLEKKQVQVIADGYYVGVHEVVNGSIELETAATLVTVGLAYTPEICMLPVNQQLPNGHNLYENKHVKNVYIDYVDSLGVYVNGFPIPMAPFDEIETPPQPKDGYYIYNPMEDWEPFTEDTVITQKEPYPMTIRAIARELS